MTEQHNPSDPPPSFQTRPRAEHPRSKSATPNVFEYIDLSGQTARFDFDRLETWPFPGKDVWPGRGSRKAEMLCRVRRAGGAACRWVLIYMQWRKDDEGILTPDELEAHPFYRSDPDVPSNRELSPAQASEWLERSWYELPEDLDPAPPFNRAVFATDRLAPPWRPGDPSEPKWIPRVVLRGPSEPPRIGGHEVEPLTGGQYEVLKALLEAGEAGLSGKELKRKSGRGDAVNILKRLSKKSETWGSVLGLAGRKGCKYRVLGVRGPGPDPQQNP